MFYRTNAQTIADGLMMPQHKFCTGLIYTYDQFENYWEGTSKRNNLNIGEISTQSLLWAGSYGITDKLNVIAMLPYIKTKASDGTMVGMHGIQDLTLSLKYYVYELSINQLSFKSFIVGSFSSPVSNYTPDYLPLSIGLGSTNIGGRLTSFLHLKEKWFINGSGGYTWRSNVFLDRPSYYSENILYMSNEVNMPNVFDLFISTGYLHKGLQAEIFFNRLNTLGGGDIRKQDMPFVSNKMNFSKTGILIMYYLPKVKGLAVRGSISTTVAGRNVGQSNTIMGGLLYTFDFSSKN